MRMVWLQWSLLCFYKLRMLFNVSDEQQIWGLCTKGWQGDYAVKKERKKYNSVPLEDLSSKEWLLHLRHKSFVTHYLFWRRYESSSCYWSCEHYEQDGWHFKNSYMTFCCFWDPSWYFSEAWEIVNNTTECERTVCVLAKGQCFRVCNIY